MLDISEREALAARKHFGAKLHELGIDDVRSFSAHSLTWKQLCERKSALAKVGRDCMDLTDDATENRAAELEAAFNGVTSLIDEVEEEKTYRESIGSRDVRESAERGDPRRPRGENGTGNGGGYEDEVEARGLRREQRFADHFDASAEFRGLSLGRYLRAMTTGAKTEAEKRALSEGSDSAGGYTVPTTLSARLIDLARARNQAIAAGAITMPLTSDLHHIAKVITDPAPGWAAESASGAESGPTFGRVELAPKTLRVIVRASREVLADSLNIEQTLPEIIAAAMAAELDRVCFLGKGTGNEPKGLDKITGVQDYGLDAAIANYSPLVTARKMVMNENAREASAWVMNPDTEASFGGLTDTTNQPLNYPSILDRPNPMRILTTTKLPSNLGTGTNESVIYGGDFGQLVIGIRNDIRIEVLRERYADTFEYGFLAYLRADVAAIQPKHLIRITGVQQAA